MLSLLLLLSFISFGQNKKEIDSLNIVINSNIKSENKLDAYSKLIEICLNNSQEKSKNLIDKLYRLNKYGDCKKCEIKATFYEGQWNNSKGDYKKSILLFEKAAQLSLKIKDYKEFQNAKTRKIQSLLNDNKLDVAENELDNYIKNAKNKESKYGMEDIYFLAGILNYRKGFLNTSIENYIKAKQFILDNKIDKPKRDIAVNNNIAQVYRELKNYPKTIEYVENAYSLAKKTKDTFFQMNVILHKGIIETDFGNCKKAIPYLNESLKYFSKNNDMEFLASSELYLGIAYYHLKQYSLSLLHLYKGKDIYFNNDDSSYAQCLSFIALNEVAINKIKDAKIHIGEAKSILKNDKSSPVYLELLNTDVKLFEKANEFSNYIDAVKTKDSFLNLLDKKINENRLNELEIKFKTQQQKQQINLLSTQNKLAQKQKYLYIGLLGLLALIGGSLFYGYRNKIKTAQKLNELNELKSRFFANISHEFRTPLTLIKSPVQSLQSEITNENQKRKLQLIDNNSTRMLELVDQLLQLSKIDSGNLKLILKDGNISSFLNLIIEPFDYQAKEKEINFKSNIQKTSENNSFDKDVIEKIVTNLISNAFKYNTSKDAINFKSSIENSNLKLIVSNSGSEVKKEELPKLFERFYQKNESQQGVGIGLALVKELVDLYKGTIETTLENGELSFIVNLPLAVSNENAVLIPSKIENSKIENLPSTETELPILLVVDDNSEIRSVLKDIFKNDYQILEAQDGEEALKIAKKEIPDCIISDVMMPKMDGFEFTKNIKNNELTSFIPVILLTAKTSDEAHLEGLKSTADAFLTKPFNNEIVKETVNQLISERKKLHRRYSQELVLRPVDIVINSVDEKFLKKLQVILDKELSNADFSSEDFASTVGMSRMQLHRKLKSLLGVSSTEFLRNERLKVAVELLKKGNGNISDVAYAVGFNDVSYFSKCFKEMYQYTPSDYLNSKKTP